MEKWTIAVLVAALSWLGSPAQAQERYQLNKLYTIAIGDRVTVQHLALSPDGRYLAICYAQMPTMAGKSEILICDAMTGKELATVSDMDPGPNRNESIWASTSEAFAQVHSCGMCFTPDSKHLAVFLRGTFSPGYVQFWDTTTFKDPRTLTLHGDPIARTEEMCFSPDGKHLAIRAHLDVGVGKTVIQLLDTTSGKCEASLTGSTLGESIPRCMAFSPDGGLLAYGTVEKNAAQEQRGELFVWDVAAGRMQKTLAGNSVRHSSGMCPAYQVAFVDQGKRLESIHLMGPGYVRRTWDLATSQFKEQTEASRLGDNAFVALAIDGPRALLAQFARGQGQNGSRDSFLVWDSETLSAFPKTLQSFARPEEAFGMHDLRKTLVYTPNWGLLAAVEAGSIRVVGYQLIQVPQVPAVGK